MRLHLKLLLRIFQLKHDAAMELRRQSHEAKEEGREAYHNTRMQCYNEMTELLKDILNDKRKS